MTTSEILAIKEARVDPRVHEILRRRWSSRSFQDRPVPTDILQLLFDAARWAPSSANEQPWRFIVATKSDPAAHQRILECLIPVNQVWAQLAPVLVISAAKKMFSHVERVNRHAWHDVGLATANLIAQATALGVSVRPMAGFDPQKARTALGVPEDFDPVTAIAIGYRGDPDLLPDDVRAKEVQPRTRKPLSEIVFSGAWEQR